MLILAGCFDSAKLQAKSLGAGTQRIRGIYIAESPPPRPVPESIAVKVAKARAQELGGIAIRGNGGSMRPLYDDGVIMIVAPVSFHHLKRGQTVVYQNRQGRKVAHVLVKKLNGRWRVAGLNNSLHDGQGVNAKNLHGVVVDAFNPVPGATFVAR